MSLANNLAESVLRDAVLGGHLPRPGSITIGLIGRGIGASLSPLMHESEGRRQGLDYRYHLIDFDRLGLADSDLPAVLQEAQQLEFSGLNITYPFKQAVLPLLAELSSDAASIGAVNTVVFGAHSVGHNTDCWGFAESLRQGLADVRRDRVLQMGAGGAGAAVAQALLQCGVQHLDLFDTDASKAELLAARVRDLLGADVTAVTDIAQSAQNADGIVNSTPVGMVKLPGLPLDAALIEARHWVADVVYFPLETELIGLARQRGCRVLPGGGMAVFQAVRAFDLFSGRKADSAAMADVFRRAVAG